MADDAAKHDGGQNPSPSPAPLPSPEEVICNRSGDVLIKYTVLKADHFPSKATLRPM